MTVILCGYPFLLPCEAVAVPSAGRVATAIEFKHR